ncbi:hypothetical protein MNV49_001817 [Pseudohyphozyma bogoriensis]|nr:hypothetical protein MNV49_001817 [Pseudohyphozyma bogoriensis]
MKKVLYWFRTDLRLHDSPALKAALDLKPAELYPTWCWDPHYVYEARVGPNRWQFLYALSQAPRCRVDIDERSKYFCRTDSMRTLSENITKVNPKSKLLVVRGPPTTVLPALFKQWGITDIVWEKDDDPYTADRDAQVTSLADSAGVKVHIVLGHTLYDSADVISKGKGCPTSYQTFVKLVSSLPAPPLPIPAPTSLPSPGNTDFKLDRKDHSVKQWQEKDLNKESRESGKTERDKSYESFSGPKDDFAVPTMEELGMVATTSIRGGETDALKVLEEFLEDKKRVATFRKPQTSPAAWEPAATTVLSPHMKFGTLSVRTFYHRVMEINKEFKGHSQPPESLIGQLLWREFFHANQAATPNFGCIRGNPTSRFIKWNLQTRYDENGKELPRDEMEAIWKREEPEAWEHFLAWKEGKTGFPWIDALMRQLKVNGWLHHLGRHSVACFLTRGQLYISWERGAEVFDERLIDWDPAINSGNWMWLSASAFFHQYYRVYSPVTYGQKYDKTGALVRQFVPELAKLPDKYVYEPWKAPVADQKKAGCVLGKDYPKRIVDEKKAKEAAITGLKAAYAAKLHVLDGTATAYVEEFEPKPVVPQKRTAPAKRKAPAIGEDKKKTKQPKLEF